MLANAVRKMGIESDNKLGKNLRKVLQQKYLFLMSLPFVIWSFIFDYLPMWGWVMAFQNYVPGKSFFEQKWVGLKYFQEVFVDPEFYMVMRNTLAMSFLNLIVQYTIPIIFAILLNEVSNQYFKRSIQTISYLPHFISWVVVAGIVTKMLSADGVVNEILLLLNITDKPVQFMAKGNLFWGICTLSDLWKELGWSSIIYISAIAGIDVQLYEAATADGAGRFRKIWHITLPGIAPTIMILMVMSIGHIISIGFQKQFLLGNTLVKDYAEVLDLYILNYGISMGRYSFGTALGVFKSVVSIVLLFTANRIFKKLTSESVI